MAIQTGLILRTVFGLALRQTEGLIGSIIHLLGIELAVPDHCTLGRRAQTVTLPKWWSRRMAGRKAGNNKAPLMAQIAYRLGCSLCEIVASTLTGRDIDDGSQIAALLDQVDGSVGVFMGDASPQISYPCNPVPGAIKAAILQAGKAMAYPR